MKKTRRPAEEPSSFTDRCGSTARSTHSLVSNSNFSAFVNEAVRLAESAKAHPEKFLSGPRPPIQPTWNVIIRVLLALEGRMNPTSDDIRFYQRDRLGRRSERGALLELMPLPSMNASRWDCAEIFGDFPTREQHFSKLLLQRIESLRAHLSYGPELVVAYGATYWDHYRRIYPEAKVWSPLGPFEYADIERTRVILTPHFTAHQMNGHRDALIQLAVNRAAYAAR